MGRPKRRNRRRKNMGRKFLMLLSIAFCVLGWIVSGAEAAEKKTSGATVRGTVQDKSGQAISNATVYLIPAADVVALRKPRSIDIKKNAPNDEPMEDTLAANRDKEHT